jgi:hypothetical protein
VLRRPRSRTPGRAVEWFGVGTYGIVEAFFDYPSPPLDIAK